MLTDAARDLPPRPDPTRGIVESWNEWDALEEVVVGIADGAQYDAIEPGYRPTSRDGKTPFPRGPRPVEVIARAREELDGLASLLEARGVTVRRPRTLQFHTPCRTPSFDSETQLGATCPRDVMITVGTEVIEAPMSRRARFFEYLAYRPLVAEYFASDPRMTWVAAPKPTMADTMYRAEFWDLALEQRYAAMHEFEYCITQDEILFDAADITRLGRDIFVQESMTTNRAGVEWLRRHLWARGIRVNRLRFPLDRYPSHIDCTFVPLCPGVALTNPERPLHESDAVLFESNGWRFIDAPEPVCGDADLARCCQSSRWLAMNVLSLSPTTVVCEAREHRLHECLDRIGLEVLVVPFTGVYEFGGSLHCATWDIRRRGTCVDYFPGGSGSGARSRC